MNFVKFLRTSFLQNTSGRLLLKRHLKVGAKICHLEIPQKNFMKAISLIQNKALTKQKALLNLTIETIEKGVQYVQS